MIVEHYSVVVIGGGPAGVGAAVELANRGIQPVLLVDREHRVGGIPAKYHASPNGIPTFLAWQRGRVLQGGDYADWLAGKLQETATEVLLGTQVLRADPENNMLELVNSDRGCFRVGAGAVIFACGARDKTVVEKGWIVGKRSARIFPTMQLLELLSEHPSMPFQNPITLGSDLIAWAASAKLRTAGAADLLIADQAVRPRTSWFARWFFRKYARLRWRQIRNHAEIHGDSIVGQVSFDGISETCDGVLVSGELVPNSELLIDAGVEVALPSRVPEVGTQGQLSHDRWFATGNQIGGFHSAHWCYRHGRRVAHNVA